MARNAITFTREYDEDTRHMTYRFTGSQRQPTLIEVSNYIFEHRLGDEIDDPFGVAHLPLHPDEYAPPDECNTLVLVGYNGGRGDGSCPICGHEHDMGGDKCPICHKRWDE